MPLSWTGRSPPIRLTPGPWKSKAVTASKAWVWSRQVLNLVTEVTLLLPFSLVSWSETMRSGSGYERGWSRTAFTTEKMAVLAPMPRARVRTAITVKPGDFRRLRRPYFRFWIKESMDTPRVRRRLAALDGGGANWFRRGGGFCGASRAEV